MRSQQNSGANGRQLGPVSMVVLCASLLALSGCQDAERDGAPDAGVTRTAMTTASSAPTQATGSTDEEATVTASPQTSGQVPSDAAYQANMSRCMSDRGWEVVVEEGSGYEVTVPEDQDEQFFADHASCVEFFGYPSGPVQVTAEEAAALYAELLEVADCVRSEGYEVSDPPSERAFVEALVSKPIPIWHPYYAVSNMGKSAADALEQACPVEVSS